MKAKWGILVFLLLAMAGGAALGTVAWLTSPTDTIRDAFVIGDINISLKETLNTDFDEDGIPDGWSGKMIPGNTLEKDPAVIVESGSEACWVFVQTEETEHLKHYLSYEIAEGWNALDGYSGVFWRELPETVTEEQLFPVLQGNCAEVKESVTKQDMERLKSGQEEMPELSMTAFAVQKANIPDAVSAWEKVQGQYPQESPVTG